MSGHLTPSPPPAPCRGGEGESRGALAESALPATAERERARRWLALLWRLLFRLRVEEAAALAFLLPTTYLTVVANVYASKEGILGGKYPGAIARLAAAIVFLLVLAAARRLRPQARWVVGLREVLPFFTCILIYTNLHDTIGFVNPHDIHERLIAIDGRLFGVQPCVWAERFITPARTELMAFLYANFFWIAPSNSLLLLLSARWREFRTATLGVVVCFFIGYFLYVAFPAAPPRLVLAHEFTVHIRGYSVTSLSAEALKLLPSDSRAAFPSLHAGVSLVALVYAWRYVRAWFWVLLPSALGLWVSTVYLRHHYVIDLIAGWALAPLAVWLAPRLDRWWAARQRALGYETALGAPGREARPAAA